MNRNVESHFAELPSVDIERSVFDRSFEHQLSGNVGDVIPFYVEEVLPGDTFRVSTSKVIRLQTLLTPTFGNLSADFMYFYCPNIILWDHWKEFCGENSSSAWLPQVTYQIPSISAPSGGFAVGTIADYMGLPVGVDWNNTASRRPSALPFRAYAKICSEFFRDQNLTDPLNISTGDSNQIGSNGSNYINDVANGGMPFKAAKFHDYFTSASKEPQKGPSVTFPLLSGDKAPVYSLNSYIHSVGDAKKTGEVAMAAGYFDSNNKYAAMTGSYTAMWDGSFLGETNVAAQNTATHFAVPNNLWADLSTSVGAVSISELRMAFQLQRYYEKLSLAGSRYAEQLRYCFGVVSPDSNLYRPEYLGGNRVPIIINDVTNTAQTSTDFLGDLGGQSVTSDISEDFMHSFTQHGYIIGVMVLRYDHSYPQGLERFWSRRNYVDFYQPVYANLANQPIFQSEICADSTNMASDTVFAYQECWADYRYKPDRCSGYMRPNVSGTLASWNFSDNYATAPTFSDSWIREDKTNVDRTLAVTSAVSHQFFADIYCKNLVTRPMPLYSIPGLIDHH